MKPDETDSGEYTCKIEQPGQPIKSISHNVNVAPTKKLTTSDTEFSDRKKRQQVEQQDSLDAENKPISLESFMKNLTIEEGHRAKFICSVIGHVKSVDWLKDNIPLKLDTDRRYRTTHSDGLVGLEIFDVLPEDSGFYTCTIRGRRNSVTSSSKLTVYESYSRRKTDRPSVPSRLHESIPRGKHFSKSNTSPFHVFLLFFSSIYVCLSFLFAFPFLTGLLRFI